MQQDYRNLTDSEIELIEKQTLRIVVQAVQEYSREARDIFENTPAPSQNEVIVLAEDLVQYALEVAEIYPINKRFAGFIDYKRVRWFPTAFGLFPQVFLVDAKASTENNRETLQQSQLSMDASFMSKETEVSLEAGICPDMEVQTLSGSTIRAITTSCFVHFFYRDLGSDRPPYRQLKSISALALPHQRLKHIYNPDARTTFYGQGKHSPKRGEAARIRVYFTRLRRMCPWRLQELRYTDGNAYSRAVWRDINALGHETLEEFIFIGR